MSQEAPPASATARRPPTGPEQVRAVQMIVLGSVLAVLGPLGGFLAGSIIGLSHKIGEFDAMYVALFLGLLAGGVGTVIAGLALLRYARYDARVTHRPSSVPPTQDP